MSVWFEGSSEIGCSIQRVKDSFANHGDHYCGVIGLMPGLKDVELVEQHDDSVTIRTNEGVMKRTNISKRIDARSVVVEFDEEYQAGSKLTTKAHFLEEFTASDTGVKHRTVIRDLEAPGFLGFFYRKFGSSSIGKALLKSQKSYLENPRPAPASER